MIRPCNRLDFPTMLEIVNDAARAYRGVIPDDCWADPYMPEGELRHEIESGVRFWGVESGGTLVAVMGVQHVGDASLIRHAYVARPTAGRGPGRDSSGRFACRRRGRCWWEPGLQLPGRSGSTRSTGFDSSPRTRRTGCCGDTGTSVTGKSRRRSCWPTTHGLNTGARVQGRD